MYLGCEGDSERAYGQILNDLLRAANRPVHLLVDPLVPGAGDPLTRVERALKRLPRLETQRSRFHLKAILMDSDQAKDAPQRAARAAQLAAQHRIMIIWQNPCHEALLLRHMPGCAKRSPQTSADAERDLTQVWPEYRKPMTRAGLARRIDLDRVRQAAGVESELRAFLNAVGLLR